MGAAEDPVMFSVAAVSPRPSTHLSGLPLNVPTAPVVRHAVLSSTFATEMTFTAFAAIAPQTGRLLDATVRSAGGRR